MKKIEFEIKGKSFEISEITIKDYYEIKNDILLNNYESEFEIISKISKCPVEWLKELSLNEWNGITFHFNILINKSLHENPQVINQFVLNGVEYGLLDWNKITIGEFADLDLILNSPNCDSRFHEILAILYRPIVKKTLRKNIIEPYDTDGFEERKEIFLQAPLHLIKAVMGFFLNSAKAFLDLMKVYLDLKPKEITQMKQALQEIYTGNGTQYSYNSLSTILSKSIVLPNSESKKHLITLFGKKNKSDKKNQQDPEELNNMKYSNDYVS